jgi:hypothetical protein
MILSNSTIFGILGYGTIVGSACLLAYLVVSDRKNRGPAVDPVREVTIDDVGFTIIEDAKPIARVRWSHVLEVFAYKEDLLSYDEIRIGFEYDVPGRCISVAEDWGGYKELVASLNARFPGIRVDWLQEVGIPSFALNWTSLWKRNTQTQNTNHA